MIESVWTRELTDRLVELWNAGHPTAEIGRRLGVGKNAVVSKVHRIGLVPRPSPLKNPPNHRIPIPANKSAQAPAPRLDPRGVGCLWPLDEGGNCGHPNIAGRPYCPEHAACAYVRPKLPAPR